MVENWEKVENEIFVKFNKKPDINGVLFLIGVRETGEIRSKFNKEEKTELLHIAMCKVLSYSGYYVQKSVDERGWSQWELLKKIPNMPLKEQENFIKSHIVEYFKIENLFEN
ncbi:MAG: hypothetical protein IT243_01240 [Bacteroidia bacterium]|nr:hypothetical protein [Bacteroidia bacterium]